MTQIAVGLFPNESVAEQVVHELEVAGITLGNLHVLAKPHYMPVTGALSTPAISFAAAFLRNLVAVGATEAEAQAYLEAVLEGGALVIATSITDQHEICTDIMNRNHATRVEECIGSAVPFTVASEETGFPGPGNFDHPGKAHTSQGGARIFTW